MRKWLLFFLLLWLPLIASADSDDWFNVNAVSSVVLPTPTESFSFMSGSLPSGISLTRGSTAWYFNSSGVLTSASSNTARFDYGSPGSSTLQGLLVEAGATNQALYSRDLTQSNWIKTSATTSLNQTGIDGTANSALSLTATAANATALQTITQSAATSVYSVYLKRITGTGTISITQDGGSTYTAVTLTSSWQRFTHAAQSTVNPSFGIKIATSGDAVAVDVNQFEAGSFATSPIITTTTTVARSADYVSDTSLTWLNTANGTMAVKFISAGTSSVSYELVRLGGASGTEDGISYFNTSILGKAQTSFNGVGGATAASGMTVGALQKAAYSYGINSYYICANNGAVTTGGSQSSAPPTAITKLEIGAYAGTTAGSNWFQGVNYWNTSLTTGQLKKATQ